MVLFNIKIFLKAEDGIFYEVEYQKNGDIVIKARNPVQNIPKLIGPSIRPGEYAETFSVYTDCNGYQAMIPPGWMVSGLPQESVIWGQDLGLVIYKIPKTKVKELNWDNPITVDEIRQQYNQFVWVPSIPEEVKLKKEIYISIYQERYRNNPIYRCEDAAVNAVQQEMKSMQKYHGFFVSRYYISKTENGIPMSVKGNKPWTSVDYIEARTASYTLEDSQEVHTHLLFEQECISMIQWINKSGTKLLETSDTESSLVYKAKRKLFPKKIKETGENPDLSVNNIADFKSNLAVLTDGNLIPNVYSLQNGEFKIVSIGRLCQDKDIGFRVAMYMD